MAPSATEESLSIASSLLQDPAGRPAPLSREAVPTRLWLALLILLTALPYLPVLGYGFVYDDAAQAVGAVAAQTSQSPVEFFFSSVWDFRNSAVSMNSRYYRPVFHAWLRINAAIFGDSPAGWHLATLAVHLAVTVLVFCLLRRHFEEAWAAFVGALLFGVHPVHLESVAWISGVTDPLATLGILGSFLLWLRKVDTQRLQPQIGSLFCFAVALLAKEIALSLPAIIFVYVLAGRCGNTSVLERKKNRFRAAAWEALPFVALSFAYLGMRKAAVPVLRNASLPWVSHSEAILTLPSAILFYVRHLVWPAGLTVFPGVRLVSSAQDPHFWVPLILLIAAAVCAVRLWQKKGAEGIAVPALTWFALPLLPVLDLAVFFRDDFVHDRYLYLPSVGMAFCCAAAARLIIGAAPTAARRRVGVAAITALVLAAAGSTAAQSPVWRNNVTLYGHAAQLSANPVPRIYLAIEYLNLGRVLEAKEIFQNVAQHTPSSWSANYYLGSIDYQLKDFPSAEIHLRRAIELDPAEPEEYVNLGLTLLAEKQPGVAEFQLRGALARNPDAEGLHYGLGLSLMAQGKIAEGKAELREELKRPSSNAALHAQIEKLLEGEGPETTPPR
jgi:protein O-mannosyl-transferase